MRHDQSRRKTNRRQCRWLNKPERSSRDGDGSNRAAWTVRMLAALEQGVEGGKWFRLFDKVFAERNLLAAFQQVASKKGAAGVDHVTVAQFERAAPGVDLGALGSTEARHVSAPSRSDACTSPSRAPTETRPLGIPTVRDRMVQAAVVNVIEPIFERDFAEHSYGFRPGRGCKDALRRVDELLKAGYVHVVDADLKGYFDSIPHDRLMARLEDEDRRRPRAVADRSVPEGGHPGRGWRNGPRRQAPRKGRSSVRC